MWTAETFDYDKKQGNNAKQAGNISNALESR